MYKLEPDDIQGMLSEAAKVLTKPRDREVMRRLVESTHHTKPDDWDKRLIAEMLAKAGKMHEAELVLNDMDEPWMRADAALRMARALHEVGDLFSCNCMIDISSREGLLGQESEIHQERLDSSAVLTELACFMHEIGKGEMAKLTAATVSDPTRREKFFQFLAEVKQPPFEEISETVSASEVATVSIDRAKSSADE